MTQQTPATIPENSLCFLCWENDHLTGLVPQGESEAVIYICSRSLWMLAEGLRTMSLRGMDREGRS